MHCCLITNRHSLNMLATFEILTNCNLQMALWCHQSLTLHFTFHVSCLRVFSPQKVTGRPTAPRSCSRPPALHSGVLTVPHQARASTHASPPLMLDCPRTTLPPPIPATPPPPCQTAGRQRARYTSRVAAATLTEAMATAAAT